MPSGVSLVGRKFGRLRVLKETKEDIYLCQCSCGERLTTFRSSLSKQVLRHCGCQLKHPGRKGNTFGHLRMYVGRDGRRHQRASSEYLSYRSMANRCLYPTTPDFKDYGGRGIQICARWLEPSGIGFKNFIKDMGPRGIGQSLDRINCNGGYEKSNCRWAPIDVQNANRRFVLWPGGEGEPPVTQPMNDLEDGILACG